MKKLIFRTLDYYQIPWYMFELNNIYHIEAIEYDGFDDPVLDGTVEYRVYIWPYILYIINKIESRAGRIYCRNIAAKFRIDFYMKMN